MIGVEGSRVPHDAPTAPLMILVILGALTHECEDE